eukprot:TRINITY_DN10110_c0_g1_i1.p1 TRINITY_DN10110_c0_g1~~TRINITY_DN10110_c0_g1_i1.p1  ORF type:complete len:352 (+),score=118.21 TRINITY_DN10110_c0_g1_i1:42-1097(+)
MIHVFVHDVENETMWCEDVSDMCTVGRLRENIAATTGLEASELLLECGGEQWADDALCLQETTFEADGEVQVRYRPRFQVGHIVEARDRKNPTNLCPGRIAEVDGRRVRIFLEGWSETYAYWTDDTSMDLAPVGTCDTAGYQLSPPKGTTYPSIEAYINENGLTAAPHACFARGDYFAQGARKDRSGLLLGAEMLPPTLIDDRPHPGLRGTSGFRAGQHLEARMRKHIRMLAVAHVVAVDGRRIRVTFDGWSDHYDYWALDTTSDIAPCGTCHTLGRDIMLPRRVDRDTWGSWDNFLEVKRAEAAPTEAFQTREAFFGLKPCDTAAQKWSKYSKNVSQKKKFSFAGLWKQS